MSTVLTGTWSATVFGSNLVAFNDITSLCIFEGKSKLVHYTFSLITRITSCCYSKTWLLLEAIIFLKQFPQNELQCNQRVLENTSSFRVQSLRRKARICVAYVILAVFGLLSKRFARIDIKYCSDARMEFLVIRAKEKEK